MDQEIIANLSEDFLNQWQCQWESYGENTGNVSFGMFLIPTLNDLIHH